MIFVPTYKQGDETDCSNYRGISRLSSTYKILSSILLSRLTPYAKEILGDHQHVFHPNRSSADHIFCIHQILDKNGNTVKQCFSKKANDSVRREVVYYILSEFGFPMKLLKLK